MNTTTALEPPDAPEGAQAAVARPASRPAGSYLDFRRGLDRLAVEKGLHFSGSEATGLYLTCERYLRQIAQERVTAQEAESEAGQ